jgi:SAM-dependent methyltransferase
MDVLLVAWNRLKGWLLQIAPWVIDRIPARVRASLYRSHKPLASYLAATPHRRKYPARFLSAIDDDDDLLHYAFPLAKEYPAFRYYRAAQMYFSGGDWNAAQVEGVLEEAGFPLSDARAFLEFAAGYGRLTRHFVQRLSPSTITVSDIDTRGVDFLRKHLGVKGFYSMSTPEALKHRGEYDMIVAVSLFSHLPHNAWGPWLDRLGRLLTPAGVLLFTTMNYDDADPDYFEHQADGFLYGQQNETRGRLDTNQYGAAFVSKEYVERVVAEHFDGRLVRFVHRALLMAQDAYVVQRSDATDAGAHTHGAVGAIQRR